MNESINHFRLLQLKPVKSVYCWFLHSSLQWQLLLNNRFCKIIKMIISIYSSTLGNHNLVNLNMHT